MPALEQAFSGLSQDWLGSGARPTILGIDGDLDPQSTVDRFVANLHISYPILADTNLVTMSRYHIGALPTSLVIDPSGRVADAFLGPMSRAQIMQALHVPS
jgi:hypothetical protein